MIQEFIRACFLILAAEMGDKTQILAMTFATKYKVRQVLTGVFIGSLLNHGLAVILGTYLAKIIPLSTIRLIAAVSFIGFGLWSLGAKEEEEEESSNEKYGPLVTVALAFFIGELGDKTQLAAIALSTTARYPAFILAGTVFGMLITSGIGIFVGNKIGKRISGFTVKLISAFVFILFGVIGLFEAVPERYLTTQNITAFALGLGVCIYFLITPILKRYKQKRLG